MAQKPKKKADKPASSGKGGGGGGGFYWVLLILLVGGLVWIFQRTGEPVDGGKKSAGGTKALPLVDPAALTNRPPPPTNLVVYRMVKSNGVAGPMLVVTTAVPGAVVRTNPAVVNLTNHPAPPTNVVVVPTNLVMTNAVVPASTNRLPRPVQDVLEAQIALTQRGFSSGPIDGLMGLQTQSALQAWQRSEGLTPTAGLDPKTKARLQLTLEPFTAYVVSSNDLARLQPLGTNWVSKSKQTELAHETVLEWLAEKSAAHTNLLRRLNPGVNWTNVVPGTVVQLPYLPKIAARTRIASVKISLSGKTLDALDANGRILAHFPCSIAARVEKRPVGELHVVAVAANPDYTFDPANFPESAEARELLKQNRKLIIKPGPNNPVGVAWIGLDKPGYGIHGTPQPELVGRTESHGCFRLANWNAELLVRWIGLGTVVRVEP